MNVNIDGVEYVQMDRLDAVVAANHNQAEKLRHVREALMQALPHVSVFSLGYAPHITSLAKERDDLKAELAINKLREEGQDLICPECGNREREVTGSRPPCSNECRGVGVREQPKMVPLSEMTEWIRAWRGGASEAIKERDEARAELAKLRAEPKPEHATAAAWRANLHAILRDKVNAERRIQLYDHANGLAAAIRILDAMPPIPAEAVPEGAVVVRVEDLRAVRQEIAYASHYVTQRNVDYALASLDKLFPFLATAKPTTPPPEPPKAEPGDDVLRGYVEAGVLAGETRTRRALAELCRRELARGGAS